MIQVSKPIFTAEELDETKTGITVGYRLGLLIAYDFRKPIKNKFEKIVLNFKDKLNRNKKRHQAQAAINNFGWARFDKDDKALCFGIKFSSNTSGIINPIGKSALKKYYQLLQYYLQTAGWKDVIAGEFGEYVVKLDNIENINNFYELSPYIGFYYKSAMPDKEYLKQCETLANSAIQNSRGSR